MSRLERVLFHMQCLPHLRVVVGVVVESAFLELADLSLLDQYMRKFLGKMYLASLRTWIRSLK